MRQATVSMETYPGDISDYREKILAGGRSIFDQSDFADRVAFANSSEEPENGTRNSPAPPTGTSQSLIPQIQAALHQANLLPADVDLVAVSVGPGSFTGLRIGIVAAKTFAFATGCQVIGVNVMDLLAARGFVSVRSKTAAQQEPTLSAGIRIGRGELIVRSYRFSQEQILQPIPVSESRITSPEEWSQSLRSGTVINGDGIESLEKLAIEHSHLIKAPTGVRVPDARSVGQLGLARFLVHGGDDLWTLKPIYSRPSAAEEVRHSK